MWAPKSDPNKELHSKGKLSEAEKMLGFKCIRTNDRRLFDPPPYNWELESRKDE